MLKGFLSRVPAWAALLTLFCLLPGLSLAAETTDTLFQPPEFFPAQGGPAVKLAQLPSGTGVLVGGVGGLVLGKSLGVGFGGYSLANETWIMQGGAKRDIGFSYYGLIAENSFAARRLFYFNAGCLIGMGQAYAVTRALGAERAETRFFIVEPQLNWMLNVTRELRVGMGISYRATGGSDLEGVLGMELRGLGTTFTLLYGKL